MELFGREPTDDLLELIPLGKFVRKGLIPMESSVGGVREHRQGRTSVAALVDLAPDLLLNGAQLAERPKPVEEVPLDRVVIGQHGVEGIDYLLEEARCLIVGSVWGGDCVLHRLEETFWRDITRQSCPLSDRGA